MHLVLNREYWPGGTNGTLTLQSEILGITIEPKAPHFGSGLSCIPEGVYKLKLKIVGEIKKIILTNSGSKGHNLVSCGPELSLEQLNCNIVLVSEITGEGRGTPSVKAWTHLIIRIAQALRKGELVSLEIRSCPDRALNLTYQQIEWMD